MGDLAVGEVVCSIGGVVVGVYGVVVGSVHEVVDVVVSTVDNIVGVVVGKSGVVERAGLKGVKENPNLLGPPAFAEGGKVVGVAVGRVGQVVDIGGGAVSDGVGDTGE